MSQPSPTPVPGHGTGWGLLLLFSYLYGIVALLGVVTIGAFAIRHFGRSVPQPLRYVPVVMLFAALGVAGFIALVAATTQMYDVVALLLLIVFLPLAYVVIIRRGTDVGRWAIIANAAMTWSVPFLVGFGVIAFAGTQNSGIPTEVTGLLAVIIVVAGTIIFARRPIFLLFE